jgi:hypothetical protein
MDPSITFSAGRLLVLASVLTCRGMSAKNQLLAIENYER